MADRPMPVIDGHNDVLLSVYRAEEGKARSFFTRSEEGHLDLPRAQEGGFAGGFFAVFIAPPPEEKKVYAGARTGPAAPISWPLR